MARTARNGRGTHAPGQMDVSTKSGTELRFPGGLNGPNVCVIEKPTSSATYVVAAKNAARKM